MSKAGERLIRSVQEALDFVQNKGENTNCIVIPHDMPRDERMRLIREMLGPDAEEEAPETGAQGTGPVRRPAASTGSDQRTPPRRVAASGRDR